MSSSADGKLWPESIYLDTRSQSEVLGAVLVFGIVLLGAFTVVALGVTAVSDTESTLSDDRAEKVLTQLDSKAGLVALGESNSQQVRFPADGSNDFSVDENDGWLRIVVENRTSGNPVEWGPNSDPELVNVTLGSISYEKGDSKLAYQGGGVFRKTDSGGMMVSPPEFHYRGGTLVLPIVNITGDGSTGTSAHLSQGEQHTTFPNPDEGDEGLNPLDNHEVKLTVQSEYYRGWGHYFEERTDGEVEYDHDAETVTLVLKTPVGEQVVENAIGATHTAGDFTLDGDGTQEYITDSYNSTEGSYADSSFGNGEISLNGDFTMESASFQINGSVKAGGLATCQSGNQELVLGSISANQFSDKDDCETNARDGADSDVSIDGENFNINDFINDSVSAIKNDPTSSSDIENNELVFDNDEATLEPGDYYLEKLEMSGAERLELKTNGEEINIAVEEYIHFEAGDSTKIDIQGTGRVNIYLNGTEKYNDDYHFYLEHSGSDEFEIDTHGDAEKSTQFWVYGKDDMKAKLEGSNNHDDTPFVGVLYAPTPENKAGEVSHIDIEGGTVYGGVVAGEVTINHGSVLFDEALQSKQAIPEDTKVVTITYLHVTENEIEVS